MVSKWIGGEKIGYSLPHTGQGKNFENVAAGEGCMRSACVFCLGVVLIR